MSDPFCPIGVVAMPQSHNFDRSKFIDFIQQNDINCCVVLDDLLLTASLGIEYPIYRSYTFEPNPGATEKSASLMAQQAVEYISHVPNYDKVYWQINNEPDVTELRFTMYAMMMDQIAMRKLPIKCVFGNFSSGSVKCGQGNDPNEWHDKAKKFLYTIAVYPQHLIGVHEYTSYTPWYSSDGGNYRGITTWINRPTHIDWKLPQWHIGRNWQGIKAACDAWSIKYPKIIVTESLIDKMEVVKENDLNGYKTYRNRWAIQFPEHKLGELYSEFLVWAWETVYAPTKQVVGITTFCYGNTGGWNNYNVADDADYLKAAGEYRYSEDEPVLPDLSNPKVGILKTPSGSVGSYVNLREEPSIVGRLLTTVANNSAIMYFPNSEQGDWMYVRIGTATFGWISMQGGNVRLVPEVDPPPIPNPEPVTNALQLLQTFTEGLWLFSATFDKAKNELDGLKKWVDENVKEHDDGTSKP